MLVHQIHLDTRSLSKEQLEELEQALDACSEEDGILLEQGLLMRNLNDDQFETVRMCERNWHTQLITHTALCEITERPLFKITYTITAPITASVIAGADDLNELELVAERKYETADMEIGNVDDHTTTWEPLNDAARRLLEQEQNTETPSAVSPGQGAVTRYTFPQEPFFVLFGKDLEHIISEEYNKPGFDAQRYFDGWGNDDGGPEWVTADVSKGRIEQENYIPANIQAFCAYDDPSEGDVYAPWDHFLADLAARDLIPEGSYLVSTCWY